MEILHKILPTVSLFLLVNPLWSLEGACRTKADESVHSEWVRYAGDDANHESLNRNVTGVPTASPSAWSTTSTGCLTNGGSDAALNGRALCPWEYIAHEDLNRYPRTLTHVRCCSQQCGAQACEPINYNIRVLRRLPGQCDDNGEDFYTEGWHRVAVGCACASAEVVD